MRHCSGRQIRLVKAYYAGRGNKFYKILNKTGLISQILDPLNYKSLLNEGIGLTDLVKCKSGMDNTLKKEYFEINSFNKKIKIYQPFIIRFNGKKAAQEYFGYQVNYGLQNERLDKSKIFVAPSTSGSANRFWDEKYWFELAQLVK